MEAVILIGIQACGKTSFCRERFFTSHIRLNLDMLKTRHRESLLFEACLEAKQSFVLDNTNPTVAERARYIVPAKQKGFRIAGYFFKSVLHDALTRNGERDANSRVPDAGLRNTARRLQLPSYAEGFDELYFVKLVHQQGFIVEPWRSEPDD